MPVASQTEHYLCMRVSFLSAGCARVLSIIRQFVSPTAVRNGVRVHNRFASDHRPYTTFVFQDCEVQRCAIFPSNVLFMVQVSAEKVLANCGLPTSWAHKKVPSHRPWLQDREAWRVD